MSESDSSASDVECPGDSGFTKFCTKSLILSWGGRGMSYMLIKQPTLAVERKEEKREEGYKGLHSGLTVTTTHELWYT